MHVIYSSGSLISSTINTFALAIVFISIVPLSLRASTPAACSGLFQSESKWNQNSQFSEKFSEDGFPNEFLSTPNKAITELEKQKNIQALEAHQKRTFIKSFFRFGWYGFHIDSQNMSKSRREFFRPYIIFKQIFPNNTIRQVHETVSLFLKEPPVDMMDSVMHRSLKTMIGVHQLLVQIKLQTGMDMTRQGLESSLSLKTLWPMGYVKSTKDEEKREPLSVENVHFIRNYISEKGVDALIPASQSMHRDLLPRVMTKLQFTDLLKETPDAAIDGFNLDGYSRLALVKHSGKVAGLIRGNDEKIQVSRTPLFMGPVTSQKYFLVTSRGNQSQLLNHLISEAYMSGAAAVYPIILKEEP